MTLTVVQPAPTILTIVSQTGTIAISSPKPSVVTIASLGTQGPAGAGTNVTKTAAVTIVAGQVVRPNGSGQLVLAQANTTNNAKGAMLAASGAAISFTAQLAQAFLSLGDWTTATGAATLTVGALYFLSPTVAGGLTTTPPVSAGQVVLHIGTAIDTTTLLLSGSDPITL